MMSSLIANLLFIGCGPISTETPCDVNGVTPGEISGSVLEQEWHATGVIWNLSGNSIQINTDMTEGWRLSVVLQKTVSDVFAGDLKSGDGPWNFNLAENGGGWATAYPQSGDSSNSRNQGGGSFTLVEFGDDLRGCLEFSTDEFSLENGRLNALPLRQ